MASIDPASALAAYLRGRVNSLSPVTHGARTGQPLALGTSGTTSGARARNPLAGASPKPHGKNLEASIARRVAAIDRNDTQRRRKAFRVFLESVLLDEWGEQLIGDPGFHRLVDDIQMQMEADSGLSRLMDEAADRMLEAVPR
jgi:hypothetical protein